MDIDLQMRKIFELLYCLLISRCNLLLPLDIFGFVFFMTILLLSCLASGMVQELPGYIFPMLFSRFSISSSECKCMAMPPLGSV